MTVRRSSQKAQGKGRKGRGLTLAVALVLASCAPRNVPPQSVPPQSAPPVPVAAAPEPAPGAPPSPSPAASGSVPVEAAAAPAPTLSLKSAIDSIISGSGVSRGTWSIVVHSLGKNDRLYERNPRTLMVPASIVKLVAVAGAVDAVGWNYSFTTSVVATGPIVNGQLRGDLVIVGSGDPTPGGRGGEDFDVWIAALKAAGIRNIRGRIIGDDNAFEDPRPGAMWAWDDLGYTSGALFGALNYAENRMAVTVTPGSRIGVAAALSVEPQASYRPLANRTITSPRASAPLIWPEQRPGEPFLTIAGSLPVGAPPVRMLVSAGNPTFWFASVLRQRLIRDGIAVDGEAYDIDDLERQPDVAKGHVIYTHRSAPLSLVVQPLLKDSVNIYAEALFRLSSGETGARNNDDALAALRQKLPAWGVDADAMQVVDGSGLSRRDALAAESMFVILQRFYDGGLASPWMTALSVAGVDGTLANRLKDTPAHGNLRAKSGTMSNIRSLAGYVTAANGEPVAFVIIVNNFEGTSADVNGAIDAIAVRLAEFSR